VLFKKTDVILELQIKKVLVTKIINIKVKAAKIAAFTFMFSKKIKN